MIRSTVLKLTDLPDLDHAALSETWRDIMGQPPPKRLSAPLMRRFLAHQVQVERSRGLTKRAENQLKAMSGPNPRPKATGIQPGGRLIREWNGCLHEVEVLDKGFSWNGDTYRSLSAIAQAITGTRWSGPRFFGLEKRRP